MPASSNEGKDWSVEQILSRPHRTILDVGPGLGTYYNLLHPYVEVFDAVEVWEPYVEEYALLEKYNTVFMQNFLDFKIPTIKYDWVILGDVIEHFDKADAETCYEIARASAHYVLVSTPVIPYPQGHVHGNPYEEHKHQYDFDGLKALEGVEASERWTELGVVVARGA